MAEATQDVNAKKDEKKDVIEVPKDYTDGVLEHQHMVTRGENVFTCNLTVLEPQKKVGTTVACDKCGSKFPVTQAA